MFSWATLPTINETESSGRSPEGSRSLTDPVCFMKPTVCHPMHLNLFADPPCGVAVAAHAAQ
jgi:hypothetical protein